MGQGPGTSRGWSPIGGVQRAKVLFPEGPSLAPGWAAEGLWGARHQPCSGPHGGLWAGASALALQPEGVQPQPAGPWGAELLGAPGLKTHSRTGPGL